MAEEAKYVGTENIHPTEDGQSSENMNKPLPRLHFRSVATQVLLVSACAFCTIGTFNALQGLGGAGQKKPYVANAATSINFGLMGIVCLLGGPVVNILGVKWALAIGTVGDPLFAAAVYQNARYGTQWFLIFASVFRGACSGLFWAAEGYVIIGYPRPWWRGRSITTWVALKELGSVVSSSINLGLSAHDNKAGHIGYDVYYVTITIMCLALPISLLMSPTAKVRHSDGTPVIETSEMLKVQRTYKEQYHRLLMELSKMETMLLLPYACFAYFYYSFAHTFVTNHFSVRGRALVALLTAVSSVIGSGLVAIASDVKLFTGAKRGRSALLINTILVLVLCAATWGYFAYAALHPPAKKLDWVDAGYGKYAASVILLFMAMQSAQTYLYWNAARVSTTVEDTAHLAGVVRGVESLGQCVAYGINAAKTPVIVSVAINIALLLIGGACLFKLIIRRNISTPWVPF